MQEGTDRRNRLNGEGGDIGCPVNLNCLPFIYLLGLVPVTGTGVNIANLTTCYIKGRQFRLTGQPILRTHDISCSKHSLGVSSVT